jgi:hypothetical protein
MVIKTNFIFLPDLDITRLKKQEETGAKRWPHDKIAGGM